MRRGANVQVAYYDQQREQLDPDRTVVDTIGDGNDTVTVNGQPRHVHGYLQDFLFSPERARSPVRALSGGERNRLLLARLFTRPANVLVLDEPTNDLDLETLELLEQQLVEWPGTLLLVSHDRRFLDNVVTSTMAFEGDGRVEEFVGGYEDYLRQTAAAGKRQRRVGEHARRVGKHQGPSGRTARRSAPSRKSANTRSCPIASPRSRTSRSSCRRRSPIPSSTRSPAAEIRRRSIAPSRSIASCTRRWRAGTSSIRSPESASPSCLARSLRSCSHCSSVTGCTDSRAMRTSGMSRSACRP